MQKKIIFPIILFLALIIGFGIGYFWFKPKQTTPTISNSNQCDVGPLFYQVQGSVADELNHMDDYVSKDRYYGKPAPIDFLSAPDAKKFYTRLTQGALQGPNAAGHYTVIQIGWTGNGYFTYIVDARTGKIILDGRMENSRWRYAIDSDLIITDGIANPSYFYGPSGNEITPAFNIQPKLFLLQNGELKEIDSLPWTFGAIDSSN